MDIIIIFLLIIIAIDYLNNNSINSVVDVVVLLLVFACFFYLAARIALLCGEGTIMKFISQIKKFFGKKNIYIIEQTSYEDSSIEENKEIYLCTNSEKYARKQFEDVKEFCRTLPSCKWTYEYRLFKFKNNTNEYTLLDECTNK